MTDRELLIREIEKEASAVDYSAPVSFQDIPIPIMFNFVQTEEYSNDSLKKCLNNMQEYKHISYYWPVEKGIKGIIKKIIRKTLKWLGFPLVNQSRDFFCNATEAMGQMYLYIQEQNLIIEDLKREIAELQSK